MRGGCLPQRFKKIVKLVAAAPDFSHDPLISCLRLIPVFFGQKLAILIIWNWMHDKMNFWKSELVIHE